MVEVDKASADRRIVGPSLPGWIQTLLWILRPIPFLDACRRRYGKVFRLSLSGWADHVIIGDSDHVRTLLEAPRDQLLTGPANDLMAPVVGYDSLFLQDGPLHQNRRRLMLRSLTREHLRSAIASADALIDYHIEQSARAGRVRVDRLARVVSMTYTLTLVTGSADPLAVNRVEARLNRVLGPAATLMAFAKPIQRYRGFASPWLWAQSQLDLLEQELSPILADAKEIAPGVASAAQILRNARDENGQILSEREQYQQALTLIIAGYDTVATAITWMIAWLCSSSEVHARVSGELSGRDPAGDGDRYPDYLEAVCLEALRLYPTVEIMSREPVAQFALGPHRIGPPLLLSPCAYLIHQDEELYPEPRRFRPERFLGSRPQPWEFFPFGLGGRSCIGGQFALMQMTTLLAKLIPRWDFEPSRSRAPKPSRNHVTIHPSRSPRIRLR